MTFTVSDALQTGWLREAQVRGGSSGLTRIVASVNVMEVPDILAWVKPHGLLLTTLYPLRDTPGPLDAFVAELAQRDLAGIIVKTGRYFDTIPEEMRIAADHVGLPLIELRSEVSFDEIITDLLGKILSVQTQRLQHSNDLGFQRILSQFENRAELHAFADELLGALEEYDRRHSTDLLLTLETLLHSNLNMAVAARSLHLHYNSLRYRLQKIEELTGPFMDDAHQRMNLELALQIRKTSRD
jgi:DNA-binding PucR family transcriptional regulator